MIWCKVPDHRLTQMIMNALIMHKAIGNEDPYYVEDDVLEKALEEYFQKLEK
jgi:hypothetical protein